MIQISHPNAMMYSSSESPHLCLGYPVLEEKKLGSKNVSVDMVMVGDIEDDVGAVVASIAIDEEDI
jgi:hypothetical protein